MSETALAQGFIWSLSGVRTRDDWRRERVLAEFARAQKVVAEKEHALSQAQAKLEHQITIIRKQAVGALHMQTYQVQLEYLNRMRDNVIRLSSERDDARQEKDRLSLECIRAQQRVDMLDAHREEQCAEYLFEQRRREQSTQDSEWLARSAWASQGERS